MDTPQEGNEHQQETAARWKAAAEQYEAAMQGGWHTPPNRHREYERDDVVELAGLLKKFFDWRNPQWQAARKLLRASGKEIVLVEIGEHKRVVYALTSEGFRRIVKPEWPFSLEQGARDIRSLSFRCVAVLLIRHWRVRIAGQIMRCLIRCIDKVAENAPDLPVNGE